MSRSLTLGAMSNTKPMEEYLVQVINYKKIEGRIRNRCWLLVSDGHDCIFCLLKPHLNYMIKNMLLQRFTVIKARFLRGEPLLHQKIAFQPLPTSLHSRGKVIVLHTRHIDCNYRSSDQFTDNFFSEALLHIQAGLHVEWSNGSTSTRGTKNS